MIKKIKIKGKAQKDEKSELKRVEIEYTKDTRRSVQLNWTKNIKSKQHRR